MDYDLFISRVPVGQKNAVDIKALSSLTRVPPRTARKIIEEINSSGKKMILNLSDGHGYFIASESEKYLERLYKAQESKRFMSLKNKLEGMNLYLETKKEPELSDLIKNQISIFDLMEV